MKRAGTVILTYAGAVLAAMAVLAGLAFFAYVVLMVIAINNYGSNK